MYTIYILLYELNLAASNPSAEKSGIESVILGVIKMQEEYNGGMHIMMEKLSL